MSITLLYAGLLGLLFFVLSVLVILGRNKYHVNLGSGGNAQMERLVRGHANFAEYVPLVLLMIGVLELNGAAAGLIHTLGASLLLGRLLHGYTFAFTSQFMAGRVAGTVLTLLALLVAGGACVWTALT